MTNPFPDAPLGTITVEFPSDPPFRAVGRLVVGGVAARADAPVERVEDLGLAFDALCMQELSSTEIRLELAVADGFLWMSLGPFESDPLSDASVARVVTPLVDWAGTGEDQTDGYRVIVRLALAEMPVGVG